jgi:hypothetical protein
MSETLDPPTLLGSAAPKPAGEVVPFPPLINNQSLARLRAMFEQVARRGVAAFEFIEECQAEERERGGAA